MMASAPGVNLRIFSAMMAFSETVAFLRRLASCRNFLRRWRLRRSSFLRSQIDTPGLLASRRPRAKRPPRRAAYEAANEASFPNAFVWGYSAYTDLGRKRQRVAAA